MLRTGTVDDSENASLSWRVIEAVAEEEGVDPREMSVLYDAIDTDALEQLVDSADASGEVSFAYNGYELAVDGRGRIQCEQATPYGGFSV